MNTTTSAEDCLEIIARLTERDGHAHVSDIARQLGITKPSVTATLKTLADRGLVQYVSYQPVELTRKGEQVASKVIGKHQTLQRFLTQCLDLPTEHADSLACKLEHELDDVAYGRLRQFLNVKTMDRLRPGERGVVVGLASSLNRRRFASYGLSRGAAVRLSKIAPLGDPRSFMVNGTEISLRTAEAKLISVQLAEAEGGG
ncbi:MAG: metal-dependent transcriptional regulator [Kiritimatiellaeota bacterium]|nr:metal-dependent transcriptional regulator [Kiritimatiellota bacterium]